MLDELWLEVFFIKVKIKGYLKNITDNTIDTIDVNGLKNDKCIKYNIDNTNHIITIKDNKIVLLRDNENYSHRLTFETNKETNTEYYIKEYESTLLIPIKTTKLNILKNKIEIEYTICDNDNKYSYVIEMSEK